MENQQAAASMPLRKVIKHYQTEATVVDLQQYAAKVNDERLRSKLSLAVEAIEAEKNYFDQAREKGEQYANDQRDALERIIVDVEETEKYYEKVREEHERWDNERRENEQHERDRWETEKDGGKEESDKELVAQEFDVAREEPRNFEEEEEPAPKAVEQSQSSPSFTWHDLYSNPAPARQSVTAQTLKTQRFEDVARPPAYPTGPRLTYQDQVNQQNSIYKDKLASLRELEQSNHLSREDRAKASIAADLMQATQEYRDTLSTIAINQKVSGIPSPALEQRLLEKVENLRDAEKNAEVFLRKEHEKESTQENKNEIQRREADEQESTTAQEDKNEVEQLEVDERENKTKAMETEDFDADENLEPKGAKATNKNQEQEYEEYSLENDKNNGYWRGRYTGDVHLSERDSPDFTPSPSPDKAIQSGYDEAPAQTPTPALAVQEDPEFEDTQSKRKDEEIEL